MMIDVVRIRTIVDGVPRELGHFFRLHKDRSGPLEAVCLIVSHPLGWELRLEIAGSLQRSQVCRSQDEVLDTGEAWRAGMIGKGWA